MLADKPSLSSPVTLKDKHNCRSLKTAHVYNRYKGAEFFVPCFVWLSTGLYALLNVCDTRVSSFGSMSCMLLSTRQFI